MQTIIFRPYVPSNTPAQALPYLLEFSSSPPQVDVQSLKQFKENALTSRSTFERKTKYQFQLAGELFSQIENLSIQLNHEEVPYTLSSVASNQILCVPEQSNCFSDFYGFAYFTLTFQKNQEEYRYYSPYLDLGSKAEINQNIKLMTEYLFEFEQNWLVQGDCKPLNLFGFKQQDEPNLQDLILLAQDIQRIYQENLNYFRSSCRFTLQSKEEFGSVAKLKTITPATLQFMANHPEYLQPAPASAPIPYYPEKTLLTQNRESKNTYENLMLVAFLKTMLDVLDRFYQHLESMCPPEKLTYEITDSLYFNLVYGFTPTIRQDTKNIQVLLGQFQDLFYQYSETMGFAPEDLLLLSQEPEPTAIFLSVPQYHQIYQEMYRWYHLNQYIMDMLACLNPVVKFSELYEKYLLAKHLEFFQTIFPLDQGWQQTQNLLEFQHPKNWKQEFTLPSEPGGAFSFVFRKEHFEITLYYQPLVYAHTDPVEETHGIGLRRFSLPNPNGCFYYAPDFLLKLVDTRKYITEVHLANSKTFHQQQTPSQKPAQYLLMDAKFSTVQNFFKYGMAKLQNNYINGTCPSPNQSKFQDTTSHLLVFCGQGKGVAREGDEPNLEGFTASPPNSPDTHLATSTVVLPFWAYAKPKTSAQEAENLAITQQNSYFQYLKAVIDYYTQSPPRFSSF